MEFQFQLLIFVFTLAFLLPCSKLVCWEPLKAIIWAKERLAKAAADAERKRQLAREAAAKRAARDAELAESHRIKAALREQARAKKAAHEAMLAAQGARQKHRTPHGDVKTEWDPHGFKHRRAVAEGRAHANGRLKRKKPDKRRLFELAADRSRGGIGVEVCDIVSHALGPHAPTPSKSSARLALKPGRKPGAHHQEAEGSAGVVLHPEEFLATSGTDNVRPAPTAFRVGANTARPTALPPLRGGHRKVAPAPEYDSGEEGKAALPERPKKHQWVTRKKRRTNEDGR